MRGRAQHARQLHPVRLQPERRSPRLRGARASKPRRPPHAPASLRAYTPTSCCPAGRKHQSSLRGVLSQPTVHDALVAEFGPGVVSYTAGASFDTLDTSRISAAVNLAKQSDVAIVVVGDDTHTSSE
eukprot:COSAG01_NODE_246_length_20450_cov_195.166822_26_plen_127_part_00